jgi:hypothetical protein
MLRITIVILTLATAAAHLSFFVRDATDLLFGLNGLGYLALLAALYLPVTGLEKFRRPARYLLMAYTAVTIAAYIAFGLTTGDWTIPLGPVTKVIEVALITLLWVEDRQEASQRNELRRAHAGGRGDATRGSLGES